MSIATLSNQWTLFGVFPRSEAVQAAAARTEAPPGSCSRAGADPALCPAPADLAAVPAALTLGGGRRAPRTVRVERGVLDLATVLGTMAAGDSACVYIPVEAPEAGELALGFGADWWLQAWLNGALILDTTAAGNGACRHDSRDRRIAMDNHVVKAVGRAGRNLLVVRLIAGSHSATLAVGGPTDVAEGDRRRAAEAEWHPHTVLRRDGAAWTGIPARAQQFSDKVGAKPGWHLGFAYLPERNRLLLETGGQGWFSDDLGANWSAIGPFPGGWPTDLGGGLVLARAEKERFRSGDSGATWQPFSPVPAMPGPAPTYGSFGPDLVDRDPRTGRVTRVTESGYRDNVNGTGYGTGFLRFSEDGGLTWSEALPAPWISESSLARAGNGDLVAVTRTDGNAEYERSKNLIPYDHPDLYSGLGVHISSDNGRTWSPLHTLYAYGRHHGSVVRLPNDDLVMSYCVRRGAYDRTPDGILQHGIEAVLSHDHGRTWDLDRRYILDRWSCCSRDIPNETYTVLLPDGSLMSAFEKGWAATDVRIVHWRPE